ncbi:3-hydroxyacyl-ACP dehydratase FabZ [Paracoccaceae bacterium GXU_MW_L88]
MTDAALVDIVEIQRLIPHRYPFLLVDKVLDVKSGESAVGIKNVTMNEPQFTGHFPAKPVFPGVYMVEAMAQTAAILVAKTMGLHDSDSLVYFMGIDKTKFRAPVGPGDVLELHVKVLRGRGKVWKFEGRAMVGETLCAETEFTAMIASPEE